MNLAVLLTKHYSPNMTQSLGLWTGIARIYSKKQINAFHRSSLNNTLSTVNSLYRSCVKIKLSHSVIIS